MIPGPVSLPMAVVIKWYPDFQVQLGERLARRKVGWKERDTAGPVAVVFWEGKGVSVMDPSSRSYWWPPGGLSGPKAEQKLDTRDGV